MSAADARQFRLMRRSHAEALAESVHDALRADGLLNAHPDRDLPFTLASTDWRNRLTDAVEKVLNT